MPHNKQQELQSLTDHLSEREDKILEEWEKRLRESDTHPSQLQSMSREEFQNHIPHYLERIYDSFRGKETVFKDIGKGHGVQRWEHGFNLIQAIKEWGTLHKVLVDQLNTYHDKFDLSSASLAQIHRTLTAHIQEGIEVSVEEFEQLQNRENEAKFQDLKDVLEEPAHELRIQNLRGTSHDLKGMVQTLQLGFSLLKDEKTSFEAKELIDVMSLSADRLEKLLNNLLDLFRLEANREEVKVSEFDAAKVLTELCQIMQTTATKEGLELKYEGTESLPVKIDRNKVERIAQNLLLNSLKYTQEGYIKVHWNQTSDDQWMLQVSDTGSGLDATHARSLSTRGRSSETDVYEKSTPEDKNSASQVVKSHGEGIGLLIVRHLSKLLDAHIDIETETGVGTTITIVFPQNYEGAKSK